MAIKNKQLGKWIGKQYYANGIWHNATVAYKNAKTAKDATKYLKKVASMLYDIKEVKTKGKWQLVIDKEKKRIQRIATKGYKNKDIKGIRKIFKNKK